MSSTGRQSDPANTAYGARAGSSSSPGPNGPGAGPVDWNVFSLYSNQGQIGTTTGGLPFDLGGFGLGVGEVVGEGVGDGGFDYGGGLAWGASLPPAGMGMGAEFDLDFNIPHSQNQNQSHGNQTSSSNPTSMSGMGAGAGGGGGGGGGISEWFSAFDNIPQSHNSHSS